MTDSMSRLVACFRRLPGVGTKTAIRYAYSIIENDKENAQEFPSALLDAKENIRFCAECGNYTEDEVCEICRTRNKKIICVVAQPKDIASFEKTGSFTGVYHVLHGTIDFRNGVGVDDLRIDSWLMKSSFSSHVVREHSLEEHFWQRVLYQIQTKVIIMK